MRRRLIFENSTRSNWWRCTIGFRERFNHPTMTVMLIRSKFCYRLNGRSSAYSPIGSDSRAGHHPAPTADTIIGFVKAWVFLATIIADEC